MALRASGRSLRNDGNHVSTQHHDIEEVETLSPMKITKYKKLFGVGLLGGLMGFSIMGLLFLLDQTLGRRTISDHPVPVRLAGFVLIAIWVCWHGWCLKTIHQWWYHDRLCTTGPFKFVKHPMYAGGIWFGFAGMSLLFNSWLILLQPAMMFFVISFLVKKEEKMMEGIFGEEYRRYASRKGRLFPRFF